MENDQTLLPDDNEVTISSTPVSKKRKHTSTDHSSEIVQVIKASLDQRQKNENLLDKDEDRHFLLSLLADFKRVPVEKKLDVKLAIIQSIKSATLPTHGSDVIHKPYSSEPYPIHPSAFFPPPQPYSNIPSYSKNFQHIQIAPPTCTPQDSQQNNQAIPILASPQTSQQINQTGPHNYQLNNPLSQFGSAQQIIIIPLESPLSAESCDTIISTDGSYVDLLTDY